MKYAHLLDFQAALSAFQTQIFLKSANVNHFIRVHIVMYTLESVQPAAKDVPQLNYVLNVSIDRIYLNMDFVSAIHFISVNFAKNM